MATPTKTESLTQFGNLVKELAIVDEQVRKSRADTSQLDAERSETAVKTIRAAYFSKVDGDTIRKTLLDAGIAKGTVSKIVTVVSALYSRTITLADVKSLHAGYSAVKVAEKAAAAAPVVESSEEKAAGTVQIKEVFVETVREATPGEAEEIILNHIRNAKDPFKASSEWIQRLTEGISRVVREASEAAETE